MGVAFRGESFGEEVVEQLEERLVVSVGVHERQRLVVIAELLDAPLAH